MIIMFVVQTIFGGRSMKKLKVHSIFESISGAGDSHRGLGALSSDSKDVTSDVVGVILRFLKIRRRERK